MELLDERWTMLIIRELLAGSRHFSELRRGVPRMSPSPPSDLRTLIRVWRGERSWAHAVRAGSLRLHGFEPLCLRLPEWLRLSAATGTPSRA